MEQPFEEIDGVISVTSGYMGGKTKNPKYEEVSTGNTGHAEVIQLEFDPAKVSYDSLLQVFWRNIDPTTKDKQFCDIGSQYRTAVFYHSDEQKQAAEKSKQQVGNMIAAAIVTEITPAKEFYPAEEYHQKYYQKNPMRYKYYRYGSGRDSRLDELWGGS